VSVDPRPGGHDPGAILAERAAALARRDRRADASQAGDGVQALALIVRGEHYAIAVKDVLETSALRSITPIPGIPAPWIGLVNLRGALRPVLDLRCHLGLGDHAPGTGGSLVVIGFEELVVALLVESIAGARRIERAELRSVPGGGASPWVIGTTADLCTLLDVQTLLADPAIVVDVAA